MSPLHHPPLSIFSLSTSQRPDFLFPRATSNRQDILLCPHTFHTNQTITAALTCADSPNPKKTSTSFPHTVAMSRRDHGSGTPSNAPSNRQNEYFIPRDGIDREVITADICRYLGNDALVRPGTYEVRLSTLGWTSSAQLKLKLLAHCANDHVRNRTRRPAE